jgi:hypothetical protein
MFKSWQSFICVCRCVCVCTYAHITVFALPLYLSIFLPDDNLVEVETCKWDILEKWLFIYLLWIVQFVDQMLYNHFRIFLYCGLLCFPSVCHPTKRPQFVSCGDSTRCGQKRESESILRLTTKNRLQEILWRLIEDDMREEKRITVYYIHNLNSAFASEH